MRAVLAALLLATLSQAAPQAPPESDPILSPDGKMAAYDFQGPDADSHLHLVLLDRSGHELRRVDQIIIDEFDRACSRGTVEWIDSARVGVTCEYMRWFDVYVVLDAASGNVLHRYRGRRFSWSPDRKVLAYVQGPTGAVEDACVSFNDKPAYAGNCDTSPKNHHLIEGPLVWSPDGRKVAFLVDVHDDLYEGNHASAHVNPREFLAIVPRTGAPGGYRITGRLHDSAKLKWLDNGRVEVALDPAPRVFDLVATPPKPIP